MTTPRQKEDSFCSILEQGNMGTIPSGKMPRELHFTAEDLLVRANSICVSRKNMTRPIQLMIVQVLIYFRNAVSQFQTFYVYM
jgi:hypothetical protein